MTIPKAALHRANFFSALKKCVAGDGVKLTFCRRQYPGLQSLNNFLHKLEISLHGNHRDFVTFCLFSAFQSRRGHTRTCLTQKMGQKWRASSLKNDDTLLLFHDEGGQKKGGKVSETFPIFHSKSLTVPWKANQCTDLLNGLFDLSSIGQ